MFEGARCESAGPLPRSGTFGRVTAPDLRTEKRLLRSGHTRVLCVDEVGRGALGGPASAGVVVIDASVRRPLDGVRDSKSLSPGAREELVPRIEKWSVASAVGHSSAAEVDEYGITAALRLAAHRALVQLPVDVDVVLLDGSHDWFTPPVEADLFLALPTDGDPLPPVVTKVKADQSCAGVAAASVLAKVERDALMVALARQHPHYGWDENKGYASPSHLDALRRFGPCIEHRRSWNLPV